MNKERDSHLHSLELVLKYWSLILAISLVSLSAFSRDISRKIKKESNGVCANCEANVGTQNLIAAHYIHGENTKSNGRALCKKCETEYHLANADNPYAIGLNREENDSVIYGHVLQLSLADQREIILRHPSKWSSVLKRLDRDHILSDLDEV